MAEALQQLRDLVTQARWEAATELVRQRDPDKAADAILALAFEQQRALFRRLPTDIASRLVGHFSYYDAYVLLYSLTIPEIAAIVDAMNSIERELFLDALPEESWQGLMKTLEQARLETAPSETNLPTPPDEPGPVSAQAGVQPIIEARKIEKGYQQPEGREIQVVAPIDLLIEPNTILALLGPSGSGKSTILRMLSGLLAPSRGEILWHGKPLQGSRPNVAIVFQSFALFPWLTVVENVEAPLLARGIAHAQRHPLALKALDSVGLRGFETAYPKELSGGMKQRVGFARALAVEPEVLFMDEPFSALDVLTAESLRRELMELWLKNQIPTKSIFLVTHNIEEAVLLADRVVVLGTHPAKIRADFRISLPQPRDRKSAEFLVYVDYIYKVMTQPELDCGPVTKLPVPRKPSLQILPHATAGGMAGLLEFLNDRGGKEDLYHLAEELLMEVDDLFPIVDEAVMLGFAESNQGDVHITPAGKEFAEADIGERKKLFREAVLSHVTLIQQIRNALERKSDRAVPLEFFRDVLDEHLSQEDAQRQIDTAMNWGRYAEIFSYDSQTDRLFLNDPSGTAVSSEAAPLH